MNTEVKRLRPECVPCVAKKYMVMHPEGLSDEQKIKYMQKVLAIVSEAVETDSAPVIVRKINDAHEEMFGYRNDFRQVKPYFNALMMDWSKRLYPLLDVAEDPLKLALQFSLIGNYIDFGANSKIDEDILAQMFDAAEDYAFDEKTYASLKNDLSVASRLVFLTDNCGEVVLDKMLLETIEKLYPNLKIQVIVRGSEVLNDVTLDDAKQVGLTDKYPVMGNGSATAGTVWSELSEEAKDAMEKADLILAKGQANFETLRCCGLNIYYLFLCKCEMFTHIFKVPRYSGILVNDKDYKE